MTWPPRFLFTSGRLSIDFTLTGGVGERSRWERWHGCEDLDDWIREHPALRLTTTSSSRDLAAARALREAIWSGARAVAQRASVSAQVAGTLNRFAARPTVAPVLERQRMAWPRRAPVSGVLSWISRDAIELFGTDLRDRLRECENPQCALLFVDLSRPGRRRWCTMRRCGNLNKLARHRTGHDLTEMNPPYPSSSKEAMR